MTFPDALNKIFQYDYADNMMSIGDLIILHFFCNGKGRVVELGTNYGRTTRFLSRICEEVITVDLFEGTLKAYPAGHGPIDYRQGWKISEQETRAGLAPFTNVKIITADSRQAARDILENSVHCLFIDADHSGASVAADFEAWKNKVRPGGYVLFHDYSAGFPDLRAFVDGIPENEFPRVEVNPRLDHQDMATSIRVRQRKIV